MNVLCVNEWLAIEKDAEIEVTTLDWGFPPPPSMAIVEEEKNPTAVRSATRSGRGRTPFRRVELDNEESNQHMKRSKR